MHTSQGDASAYVYSPNLALSASEIMPQRPPKWVLIARTWIRVMPVYGSADQVCRVVEPEIVLDD
jgi:hypothetical protein